MNFEQNLALIDVYKQFKNQKTTIAKAKLYLKETYGNNILNYLANKGLIVLTQRSIQLSEEGLIIAQNALRKFGILKMFCEELLGLSQKESTEYIEKVFFAIDDFILEKYCTLLGHPAKSFPEGTCCKQAKDETSEEVIPLSLLPVNTPAIVVYIRSDLGTSTLQKIFSLDLYPGKTLQIHQLYPTYVIHLEDEELAIEKSLADQIYVKK